MSSFRKAPFTPSEVGNIINYQYSRLTHGLTCNRGNCGRLLRADAWGLRCCIHDFAQDWVPAGVADGSLLKETETTMATLTEHQAARKEKLAARVNFLIDHDFLPHTDGTWRYNKDWCRMSFHSSFIESWSDEDWDMLENMIER